MIQCLECSKRSSLRTVKPKHVENKAFKFCSHCRKVTEHRVKGKIREGKTSNSLRTLYFKTETKSNKISLVKNSLGHLHIFKGIPKLSFTNPKNITKEDKTESERYIQIDYEIEDLEKNLSETQKKDLENGYRVVIEDLGFF